MRCNSCGETFEYPDKVREQHGEDFYVCPHCKDWDIEETVACEKCGKENDHLICKDCAEDLSTDEVVLRYSEECSEDVKLGGMFAYHFSPSDIEQILLKEMKDSGSWESLKEDFIHSDYGDYLDWLEENM